MNPNKWWHRPRPAGFLNYGHDEGGHTQYVDEYIKYNVGVRESFKPPTDLRQSKDKVSGDTTFRLDYIPHPLPDKTVLAKEVYRPPENPMDCKSMYTQDYPIHQGERAKPIRHDESRKIPNVKFDANPTYTSDFKKWALPPKLNYRPDREFKAPDVKMEGVSTFQRDYTGVMLPPRESAKPPNMAFQSDQPLESHTIHKLSFVPHKPELRKPRERVKFQPPTVAMSSHTTARNDYTGQPSLPAETCKPSQTHFLSKEPLASSSEFRDSFVAWPVLKPYQHPNEVYKGPQGDMDLQTVNRLEYRTFNARPPESKKPPVRRAKTMPFNATTNYSQDFKKWAIQRELRKSTQEYVRPEEKFVGYSTMKGDFIRHSAQPTLSCRPDARAFMSDAPFQDRTIYRGDYVKKSMEQVERYPTPDWLKHQEEMWRKQGYGKVNHQANKRRASSSHSHVQRIRSMTPMATPVQMVQVAA